MTRGCLINKLKRAVIPVTGLAALVWFLIRVIPKPSRAFYPCQRAAFPLAAAFVAWIVSSAGSVMLFRKGKLLFTSARYLRASLFVLTAVLVFGASMILAPRFSLYAENIVSRPIQVSPLKSLVPDDVNYVKPVSTVSIVKSTKNNAEDLTYSDIKVMVQKAILDAGGLGNIISDGDTVVIKPNLVSDKESASGTLLQDEVNGITADWRIVKSVSEIVRELNPSGKIFVMEGSAKSTQALFDMMNYDEVNMPEVDRFFCLESSSGGWREYSAPELKVVNLPADKKLYPDNKKPYNSAEYYLNKIYYDADVLISIALIKNHESASVTGSIKNLCIGASPANIYGLTETNTNRGTIDHGTNLHAYLHDFYLCRPADFAIMDGLQGLEFGPVAVTSSQSYADCKQNMRLILASSDLLALDAIEALLETYDPSKIKYMVDLHNDDAGCADPTLIKVVGNKVADERKDFEHNKSTGPKFSDNIHPDFSISDISLDNDDQLRIQLASYVNIDKIELALDGNAIEEIFIAGFDDLLVDISGIDINEQTELTIIGYNKYLNYKEINLSNILSVGLMNGIKSEIGVYPTAMNEVLFIEGIKDPATLTVYDLTGRIFKTEYIAAEKAAVTVSDLRPGIYLIEINSKGQKEFLGKVFKL